MDGFRRFDRCLRWRTASPNDDAALEAYLETHPLPGNVGVDFRDKKKTGIGETFDAFFIHRFNLPRLVLLDIDGEQPGRLPAEFTLMPGAVRVCR